MRVILSNWLLSTLRIHRYPIFMCAIAIGYSSRQQFVNLLRVEHSPHENRITVTWIFTQHLDVRLRDSEVFAFLRYDGQVMSYTSFRIPSDYRWGDVIFVENIRLINAE
jgi:hypothetical protein